MAKSNLLSHLKKYHNKAPEGTISLYQEYLDKETDPQNGLLWAESKRIEAEKLAKEKLLDQPLRKLWSYSESRSNMKKELQCTIELAHLIDTSSSMRMCGRPLTRVFLENCGNKEPLLYSRDHLSSMITFAHIYYYNYCEFQTNFYSKINHYHFYMVLYL